MAVRDQIAAGLAGLSLPDSEASVARCQQYLELIARWNEVTNLTAVRHVDDMVSLHLMDSLSILPFMTGSSILDVGSGAGLPGIPLAMFCPDKDFILLDSSGKKTRFMTQATIELGLANVQVVRSRIEDFQQTVDQVVCRAFASLNDFFDLCNGLVGDGGSLLAMKGPVEEQGIQCPGWQMTSHKLNVPMLDGHRVLIEMSR